MSILELLQRARARIADVSHWTQFRFAESWDGEPTDPCSPESDKWCAWGALLKEDESESNSLSSHAAKVLARNCPPSCPQTIWVNDRLGHEAVLKVYDRAIAELERGEALV